MRGPRLGRSGSGQFNSGVVSGSLVSCQKRIDLSREEEMIMLELSIRVEIAVTVSVWPTIVSWRTSDSPMAG